MYCVLCTSAFNAVTPLAHHTLVQPLGVSVRSDDVPYVSMVSCLHLLHDPDDLVTFDVVFCTRVIGFSIWSLLVASCFTFLVTQVW